MPTLLRALYDFTTTHPKTLSFRKSEMFLLLQKNSKDKNWWHVISERGQVGYIPINYVSQVQHDIPSLVDFIDGCLEAINLDMQQQYSLTSREKRDIVQRMMELRRSLLSREIHMVAQQSSKRPAPQPPSGTNMVDEKQSPSQLARLQKRPAPHPPGGQSYLVHQEATFQSSPTQVPTPPVPSRTSSLNSQDYPPDSEFDVKMYMAAQRGRLQVNRSSSATNSKLSRGVPSLSSTSSESSFSMSFDVPSTAEDRSASFVADSNKNVVSDSCSDLQDPFTESPGADVWDSSGATPVADSPGTYGTESGDGEEESPPSASQTVDKQNPSQMAATSGIAGESASHSPSRRRGSCSQIHSSMLAQELVERVRVNTKLSHELSQVAVHVVIDHLIENIPSISKQLTVILDQLQQPVHATGRTISESQDAERLKVIFEQLTECREDEQQRNWMIQEDEPVIVEYLQELSLILSSADSVISCHVMTKGNYHYITSLVLYYQMETRWSIRQLLIQVFGIMCSLDVAVITILLNSVLPMELARDMKSSFEDVQRLSYSALLLTMIMSMGEALPVIYFEHLGEEFIEFLLGGIESPPANDIEEQIPDSFLSLLLAYNLQFSKETSNLVVKTLQGRGSAKVFTEKVLLLLNREEDPACMFSHKPRPPNCVIKLFLDIFSNEKAASLFYTNDIKVLIDIIVRQLCDLSAGEEKRSDYLELCQMVLRHVSYEDHQHRRADLQSCFTRILQEEDDSSAADQRTIRGICHELPQHFTA